MRKLLLSFFFLCSPAFAQWVEGTTIGVRADNSTAVNALFVNSWSGYGPQAGVWSRIAVRDLGVPEDAISVFLTGILVITHGYKPQTCDLHLSIRAPGDNMDPGNYIGQAVEVDVHGGQRSNMSSWAPVRDGHIEVHWTRSTLEQWPEGCAYGMSLSAQAYLRK